MKSVVALLLLAAVASYGVAADDDRACSSHIPTESEVGSVIDAIKSFWDKIWPFRHRREVNMDRLSASRRVPGSTLNQPIIIALHYFFFLLFYPICCLHPRILRNGVLFYLVSATRHVFGRFEMQQA